MPFSGDHPMTCAAWTSVTMIIGRPLGETQLPGSDNLARWVVLTSYHGNAECDVLLSSCLIHQALFCSGWRLHMCSHTFFTARAVYVLCARLTRRRAWWDWLARQQKPGPVTINCRQPEQPTRPRQPLRLSVARGCNYGIYEGERNFHVAFQNGQ